MRDKRPQTRTRIRSLVEAFVRQRQGKRATKASRSNTAIELTRYGQWKPTPDHELGTRLFDVNLETPTPPLSPRQFPLFKLIRRLREGWGRTLEIPLSPLVADCVVLR